MSKSIGFYGGDYNNPAIAKFSEQFEDAAGNCRLPENDQAALVAVLGTHAWGLKNGDIFDFYENAERAVGNGDGTSAFDGYGNPMHTALEALSTLTDAAQCYSLIAWLLQ